MRKRGVGVEEGGTLAERQTERGKDKRERERGGVCWRKGRTERERERERETDRQIQTDRQRQTDRQTETGRERERERESWGMKME